MRGKLVSLALALAARLENDGDADLEKNGERRFLHDLFRYLRNSGSGPLVLLDVGANVGDYSRLLLGAAPLLEGKRALELHAFEPALKSFEALQQALGSDRRLVLNRAAASNQTGSASIFSDTSRSPCASLHRREWFEDRLAAEGAETVATLRLDEYLKSCGIGHVDFLKLDVEGHELAALEGLGDFLSVERLDFVQFEYGGTYLDAGITLRDVYRLFEGHGFAVAKVMPGGLELRDYQPRMENFQYANYVAISRKLVARLP